MPFRACLALPVLVLLMGCDGERTLANAAPTRLRVVPLEQLLTLEVKAEPPCAFLPKVTATQNGVVLRQVSAGERSQATFVDVKLPTGPAICEGPVWEMLPTTDATPVTLVLEDASASITAEVATRDPANAGFTVVTPASGIAHPGETVTVEWNPTADLLLTGIWSVRISINVGGGADVTSATPAGSRLSFVVPAAKHFYMFGAGELVIVGPADRHFARCEGVPACTSPFNALSSVGRAAITIEP